MSLLASRGAAEHLSRRLDVGDPIADDRALALALQLQATGVSLSNAVLPRPDFRAALHTRLVAVATIQANTAAAPAETVNARHAAVSSRAAARGSWRAAAAAGALASVTAVAGVAAAGTQSLPGEPFYGVKTATEAVQLRLAGDDVATGTLHLELAATRLREVRALSLGRDADQGLGLGDRPVGSGTLPLALGGGEPAADRADRVRETLAAMDEQTREGMTLLTGAWRSTRATEPLRTLARWADQQRTGLADLLPSMPSGSQEQAQASLALVSGVAEQADGLLAVGSCTAACDPGAAAPVPGARSGPGGATRPDCTCPSPAPAPSVPAGSPGPTGPTEPSTPTSTAPPAGGSPTPDDTDPDGTPPTSPGTSPSPSPSTSGGGQPLPVPTLPLPLPTLAPLLTPGPLGGVPTDADDLEGVLGGLLDPLTP